MERRSTSRAKKMATNDNTTLTTALSKPAQRPTVSSWVSARGGAADRIMLVVDQEAASELPSRVINASSMPCRWAVASSMSEYLRWPARDSAASTAQRGTFAESPYG